MDQPVRNDRRFKDLTGRRYGRLVVLRYAGRGESPAGNRWPSKRWLCRCDCGVEKTFFASSLRKGTQSCGCLQRELARVQQTTHGLGRTRIYNIWQLMLKRCNDPANSAYPRYGGRGIHVCERWHSLENFIADMGHPSAGLSLERKNNDGHYEPDNCRWADRGEQAANRRTTVTLTHQGRTQHLEAWAREVGVDSRTITKRLRRGWPVDRALSQ